MTTIGVIAHEGKTRGDGLGELRAALADARFADAPWRQVWKSREAPKQVRRLRRHGGDRVLVWGGHGTVRRCIDTIVEEDARLDIGVITAEHRRDWVRIGMHAVTGHIDASPLVDITQGTKFKLEFDHKMPWELDGGDRPKAKLFDGRVLPGRLPVCVPAS